VKPDAEIDRWSANASVHWQAMVLGQHDPTRLTFLFDQTADPAIATGRQ